MSYTIHVRGGKNKYNFIFNKVPPQIYLQMYVWLNLALCLEDKKWKQVQHQSKYALKASLINIWYHTYTCTTHKKEKVQEANS